MIISSGVELDCVSNFTRVLPRSGIRLKTWCLKILGCFKTRSGNCTAVRNKRESLAAGRSHHGWIGAGGQRLEGEQSIPRSGFFLDFLDLSVFFP